MTLLVAFVVVVFGGYALAWGWTGFQGNTLWDWLRLLLVPFVLPATLAWFSARAEFGARHLWVTYRPLIPLCRRRCGR